MSPAPAMRVAGRPITMPSSPRARPPIRTPTAAAVRSVVCRDRYFKERGDEQEYRFYPGRTDDRGGCGGLAWRRRADRLRARGDPPPGRQPGQADPYA